MILIGTIQIRQICEATYRAIVLDTTGYYSAVPKSNKFHFIIFIVIITQNYNYSSVSLQRLCTSLTRETGLNWGWKIWGSIIHEQLSHKEWYLHRQGIGYSAGLAYALESNSYRRQVTS